MIISQKSSFFVLISLLFCSLSFTQTLTQTVKGRVVDAETKAPLMGADILLINSNPAQGGITEEQGFFRLEGVPVWRASFQITYLGYEDFVVSEILIGSAKEVDLTIFLTVALN